MNIPKTKKGGIRRKASYTCPKIFDGNLLKAYMTPAILVETNNVILFIPIYWERIQKTVRRISGDCSLCAINNLRGQDNLLPWLHSYKGEGLTQGRTGSWTPLKCLYDKDSNIHWSL